MADSPSTPKQKKTGLRKLWIRVKAVISTKPSKKANATSAVQPQQKVTPATDLAVETTPAKAPEPIAVTTAEPELEIVKEMETPGATVYSVPKDLIVEKDAKATIPVLDAIEVDESEDLPDTYELPVFTKTSPESTNKKKYDQAQVIYEKYGIPLNITDWRWSEKPGIERVEKKTRMRVRYTCHMCQNVYGRDKMCSNCQHDRAKCTECVRYPAKRTGEKVKTERVIVVEPTVPPITKGACHECKTDFSIGDKSCQNCEHTICERCLRETVLNAPVTASPVPNSLVAAAS